MPGCCAVGCSNRRENGYKMFSFPSGKNDVLRRHVWLSKVNRCGFTPTNSTLLCQAHFEMDQFEPKIPGKLKRTAVPTIFSHLPKPNHRKCPKEHSTVGDLFVTPDSVLCRLDQDSTPRNEILPHQPTLLPNFAVDQSDSLRDHTIFKENLMEAELNALRRKYNNLQKEHENLKSNFSKLFNPDQLHILELNGTNSTLKWSDETVKKALQLHLSCGCHGYSVLLSQGFPFPSARTLRRRLKNAPFHSDIKQEVFDELSMKEIEECICDDDCFRVYNETNIYHAKQ